MQANYIKYTEVIDLVKDFIKEEPLECSKELEGILSKLEDPSRDKKELLFQLFGEDDRYWGLIPNFDRVEPYWIDSNDWSLEVELPCGEVVKINIEEWSEED